MKFLVLALVVCFTLHGQHGFADVENASSLVAPIQEIAEKSLEVHSLPKESVVGSLAEHVNKEGSILDNFSDRIWPRPMLYPQAEGLAYLNGYLSHVGNYPRSIVYTVLEGPQYGLQIVMTYDGIILYVNYDFDLERAPGGVIFHHYYEDSTIITGSTQVISFY